MIDWNKINGGFLAPDRIPMEERNKDEMILELQKETHEKDKEITRLNNIINELENFINTYAMPEFSMSKEPIRHFMETKIILDKLKELKEGK